MNDSAYNESSLLGTPQDSQSHRSFPRQEAGRLNHGTRKEAINDGRAHTCLNLRRANANLTAFVVLFALRFRQREREREREVGLDHGAVVVEEAVQGF